MSGPSTPRPDLVRVGSSRRGALPGAAAVALVLGSVVSAGLLGRPGPDVSAARPSARTNDGAASVSLEAATDRARLRDIEAARLRRLGPPPWVANGRTPVPTSSRLRVLGWQVDPYET